MLREPGLLVEGKVGSAAVYRNVLIDKIWSPGALCQILSVHGAVGHPGQSPRVAPQVEAKVA